MAFGLLLPLLGLAGGGQYALNRFARSQKRDDEEELRKQITQLIGVQPHDVTRPGPNPQGAQAQRPQAVRGSGLLGGNEQQRAQAISGLLALGGPQAAGQFGQQMAQAAAMPPQQPEPTTLMRNLISMGLQPGTPEYEQAMREVLTKSGTNIQNIVGGGGEAPLSLADLLKLRDGKGEMLKPGTTMSQALEQGARLAAPPEQTEFKTKKGGLDILRGTVDRYAKMVNKHGPQFSLLGINADDATEISSAYTSLMIQAKELFNLGVLQGPDMKIIEEALPNPTSLMNQALSKRALVNGINEIVNLLNDNYKTLGTTYDQDIELINPYDVPDDEDEPPTRRTWRRKQ